MATKLTTKEVSDIFMDFINEMGIWNDFKNFISDKGYSEEELEIEPE
jgi:hypothetical protein